MAVYKCRDLWPLTFKYGDAGPTVILSPVVSDMIANVSDEIRLPCEVRTDPAERENLRVEWRRDGVPIDPSHDHHVTLDEADFSLYISSALVTDTAAYTCHADNGLDQATSEPTNVVVSGMHSIVIIIIIRIIWFVTHIKSFARVKNRKCGQIRYAGGDGDGIFVPA